MNYLRRHLGARIALLFIVMMSAFGLLMGLYIRANVQKLRTSQTNHLTLRGSELARALSSNLNLVFAILSFDKKAIDAEFDQGYSSSGISYLVVYNEYAKPITSRYQGQLAAKDFDFPPPDEAGCDKLVVNRVRSIRRESFLDIAMPVRVTQKSLVPVGQDDACIGWVRLGLSLSAVSREVNRAIWEGAGLFVLVTSGGVLIIAVSLYWVLPPLGKLTRAARRIGTGDLDTVVAVDSVDEIGVLASTVNRMTADLRDRQRERDRIMETIAEAVNLIGGSSSQILAVAVQQAEGAATQASVIEQIGATVTETAATANQIAEQARSVSEDAVKTSRFCEQGTEFMDRTAADMNELQEKSRTMAEHADELRKKAYSIGGVIGIMEEIGNQIGLLALNAQIEAASAGAHGKRFAVVAVEVKDLASRSLQSADTVRHLVSGLRNSIASIVSLMEHEQAVVLRAAESAAELGQYFQKILDQVSSTATASSTIEIITSQQASATGQIVSSIKEVENVTQEVLTGVKEIEAAMGELKTMAEDLSGIILEDAES